MRIRCNYVFLFTPAMRSEDKIEFTYSNVETVVVLSPFVLSAWGSMLPGNEIGHVIYSHALCFDRPAFDGHEFAFADLLWT